MVNVGAFNDGDVIAQQLQRSCVEDRGDNVIAMRHAHNLHITFWSDAEFLIGKNKQFTTAGTNFFNVRLQLFDQLIVGCHNDDRHF